MMTTYDLSKETETFQLGYWDAYSKQENWEHNFKGSYRAEYARGYLAGKNVVAVDQMEG